MVIYLFEIDQCIFYFSYFYLYFWKCQRDFWSQGQSVTQCPKWGCTLEQAKGIARNCVRHQAALMV